LQIKTKIVSCHTADSKPVKQEVKGTVILPPLVFPGSSISRSVSQSAFMIIKLMIGCAINSASVFITLSKCEKVIVPIFTFLGEIFRKSSVPFYTGNPSKYPLRGMSFAFKVDTSFRSTARLSNKSR
jgi:hypothetical protein